MDFTLIEVFRQRRHQISKALHAEDETDGGSLEGSVFRGALASVVPELTATMIEDIMVRFPSFSTLFSLARLVRLSLRLLAMTAQTPSACYGMLLSVSGPCKAS